MVFLPNLDTKSFKDVWRASVNVLADSWRDSRGQFVILGGLAVLAALLPYLLSGGEALLVNHLIEVYHLHRIPTLVQLLIFAIGGIIFCREALSAASQHFQLLGKLRRQQHYDLKLNERVSALDVATHESKEFRDQLQVVHEHGGPFAVAMYFNALMAIAGSVLSVVTGAGIVLLMDYRLFLLIVVASIPRFYVEVKSGKKIFSIFGARASERRQYIEMTRHMDTTDGVRELQLFQTRSHFLRRQEELLDRLYGEQRETERKRFWSSLIAQAFIAAAIYVSIQVLVGKVTDGSLLVGSFLFVFVAIVGLQDAIAGLFLGSANLMSEARYVASFFDILAREPFIKFPVNGVKISDTSAPRIEFRNVSFAYPKTPDELVLKDFNLTIEPGERIAIVGLIGAGKSTLMKLLCRSYDPTEGQVLINGVDLCEVDRESWYHCLGFLMQDFQTYHVPVSELIALGRLGERDEGRVICAAKRAHADEFIRSWPDSYRQQIGKEFDGIDPSGGQEQLLALARTLYRDALVTILDEPTAHVDALAEEDIFIQLEESARACRTQIFIAHRFSTVRRAHRICVIEHGRVAELGTHEELLAAGKSYATLFKLQAAGYQ